MFDTPLPSTSNTNRQCNNSIFPFQIVSVKLLLKDGRLRIYAGSVAAGWQTVVVSASDWTRTDCGCGHESGTCPDRLRFRLQMGLPHNFRRRCQIRSRPRFTPFVHQIPTVYFCQFYVFVMRKNRRNPAIRTPFLARNPLLSAKHKRLFYHESTHPTGRPERGASQRVVPKACQLAT